MDNDAVLKEFSKIARSGGLGSKLYPSLIGMDSESFFVTWPEGFPQERRFNIPEFISSAFNGIDAYATALLASDVEMPEDDLVRFSASMSLDKHEELRIHYLTLCGPGLIMLPKSLEEPIANAMRITLETKGMRPRHIQCNDLCALTYQSWVGTMRVEDSILAGLDETLWPSVERRAHLTPSLREQARSVLALLTEPLSRHMPE